MERSKSTRVQIFGSEYHVKAEADPDYIKTVAAYVDEKMREVAESQSIVSSTKVAILAAINLADEVFQERRKREQAAVEVAAQALELTEPLAREL
jgi:cell division protein ZapA